LDVDAKMSAEPGRAVRRTRRTLRSTALVLLVAFALAAITSSHALASTNQQAMFEDDVSLFTDPVHTLAKLRLLGVGRVRVAVRWSSIAPRANSFRRPSRFDASNPAAYPAANWGFFDGLVRQAQQDGISLEFTVLGGAPLWATGPGAPTDKAYPDWSPSASEFGAFVRAVAKRYSGSYTPRGSSSPLPRISFWSVWNEPNYGPSLAPQGLPGNPTVENSPQLYRGLLDAAWTALQATGHGGDTIVFGDTAPRGVPNAQSPGTTFGLFQGMKPLVFLRALYCVDSSYQQLRGAAATERGCPATSAGSRGFPAAHPALFNASGFAVHPYDRWFPPTVETPSDPDYASLALLGNVKRALDRLQRVYGSQTRLPIWNTEYGYLTSPPKHRTSAIPYVSPRTAAYYINWAEYISWRDPRMMSTMQYLLADHLPALASNGFGGYASGLIAFNGRPKATYSAYRLPLYLPVTTARRGKSFEVWGCVRPAHYASIDTGGATQVVAIQFQLGSRGPFTTVRSVTITDPHGYFDVRVPFPASGTVRLTWTYPANDPLLAPGYHVYSRHVQISER
jgi:hypothetical protein